MFIDKIKENAKKHKPKFDMDYYKHKIRKMLMANSYRGMTECKVWLPYKININKFNEFIKEDGIECVFLYSNPDNTKYKVHVSERIDTDKFWKMVERNRKRHEKL